MTVEKKDMEAIFKIFRTSTILIRNNPINMHIQILSLRHKRVVPIFSLSMGANKATLHAESKFIWWIHCNLLSARHNIKLFAYCIAYTPCDNRLNEATVFAFSPLTTNYTIKKCNYNDMKYFIISSNTQRQWCSTQYSPWARADIGTIWVGKTW